jgi:mycobactin peptide synthetase MbtE
MRSSIQRGPATDESDRRRLDQLVDHWSRETPAAVAVRCDGVDTTYGDLVGGADRVAAGLRAAGVSNGEVVVVRLPRGVALYQTLLAVLKCGAIYAAPDPSWPAARCAQLVERTAARWFVGGTGADQADDSHAGTARHLYFDALLSCDGVFHPAPGDLESPACVFLTSGSTGQPKAALMRHCSVLRVARDPILGFAQAGTDACVLQAAPSPWDAFAMELWAPLVHGGTVVVDAGKHLGPHEVRAAIELGVNRMFLTTSLFNLIADTDPAVFAGLHTLISGGERASTRHFNLVLAANPGLRLINGYGPVEACVFTNAFSMPESGWAEEVPLGEAIAGTTVYILDAHQKIVPYGEPGEIAIAGQGLALCYINAPEATSEAFRMLADPDSAGGPVRIYLTGDRGRLDAERGLIFLGRGDRQVKIRGVRVEPAEVEAVVAAVPGVARAVVQALPYGAPTKTHLAACVVPVDPAATLSGAQIKAAVRRRMPDGFVPDFVFQIADTPLTPNGKLDEAGLALIIAELRTVASAEAATPAGDELPEQVREIMTEAAAKLGTPIGPDIDVFDNGGTSITAILLAHWLTERAGERITAVRVMELGTPRKLAELLPETSAPDKTAPAPAPSAQPSEQRWISGVPVPQWRFWFLDARNPGTGDVVCPLEFYLKGIVDPELMSAAIREVVSRHEALRTQLVRVGERGVAARVVAIEELCDVLRVHRVRTSEEAVEIADALQAEPFDLTAGIPVRAALITLPGRKHLLSFAIHHTAFDGWSIRLFCRDLSAAYRAIAECTPLPPAEPTRYHQSWLDQDLSESDTDRIELMEWSRGLLGVPDLPIVEPGTLAPSSATAEVWADLPPSVLAAARDRMTKRTGTVQTLLLASWVRALRRLTGADDFAIGIPVTGRTAAGSLEVIGCFANGVAARFTGSPGRGFDADLADAERELALALRFQFMPTELLLREESRDRTRNPFCQAGFVVQDARRPLLGLPGVDVTTRRRLRAASAFEVTAELFVGESAIEAHVWYRTDVLTPERAAELAGLWSEETAAAVTLPAGT